jgi:hypothetical protein
MLDNAPAVAEPAKALLLKYCTSRNQATYVLFLGLLVAGWDGGRVRGRSRQTALLWEVGTLGTGKINCIDPRSLAFRGEITTRTVLFF